MSNLDKMSDDDLRRLAVAAKQLKRRDLSKCFDPQNPKSRPSKKQQEVLDDLGLYMYRYMRSGNQSGKTATAAREFTWVLNGDHPSWTRPTKDRCPACQAKPVKVQQADYSCAEGHTWRDWGDGPLLMLVAGQDRQMMEVEVWGQKILPFLNAQEWRPIRRGGFLIRAENRKTGDTIVFLTHADSSDKNRKHMQGYVAHYVWVDEMPASPDIFEELQRRVDSRRGIFIATFTSKFKSPKVRRMVDAAAPPVSKSYKLTKFDNPIFAGREEEEMAKLAGMSLAKKRSILFGEWFGGESTVFDFTPELHGGSPPETYSYGWRHVLSVDPATESRLGMTVWAQDPGTLVWWCVRAEYVEGVYVPTKIVDEVEKRVERLNIVRRVYDPAASWYARQAADMPDGRKFMYMPVFDKNRRKEDLLAGTQQALYNGYAARNNMKFEGRAIAIADWCTDLHEEMNSMERSESDPKKIVNSNRYHLIDSANYFVDLIPEDISVRVYHGWEDRLYQGHLERKAKIEKMKKVKQASRRGRRKRIVRSTVKRRIKCLR